MSNSSKSYSKFLSTNDFATLLGVTPAAVRKMRERRQGPDFIQVSKKTFRYPVKSVETWLQAKVKVMGNGKSNDPFGLN